MELIDRELLAELMDEQDVSGRELARFAGWRSHTYLQRLLNGKVRPSSPTRPSESPIGSAPPCIVFSGPERPANAHRL